MDSQQTKEDSDLNETRIIQILRERSSDEKERIIKGSANWCKENLGDSDEIENGIGKMLERLKPERPAEEEGQKAENA